MSAPEPPSRLFHSRKEATVYLVSLCLIAFAVAAFMLVLLPQAMDPQAESLRPTWLLPVVQVLWVGAVIVNVPQSIRIYRRRYPSAGRLVSALNGPTYAAAPQW